MFLSRAISAVLATTAAVEHEFEHVAIAPAPGAPPCELLDAEPADQDDKEPGRDIQYID